MNYADRLSVIWAAQPPQARQRCQIYESGSSVFVCKAFEGCSLSQPPLAGRRCSIFSPHVQSCCVNGVHTGPRHSELCFIAKQKWKVIVSLWMSSLCLWPKHQHSVLWWHWRKRKEENERNRERLLSPCHRICSNCTSECRRMWRGGHAGERIVGAIARPSMVAFFRFCGDKRTRTHTHTQTHSGGFPHGRTQVQ